MSNMKVMKRRSSIIMGVMILPTLLLSARPYTKTFKLVKRENHIAVYERWIQGREGEKVRELKAVFVLHTTMKTLLHTLKDPNMGKKWNSHTSRYVVVSGKNKGEWISYLLYDMPWPIDRKSTRLN